MQSKEKSSSFEPQNTVRILKGVQILNFGISRIQVWKLSLSISSNDIGYEKSSVPVAF